MKQDVIGSRRLIRVKFIEKFVTGMLRVSKVGQFSLQNFCLFVGEDSNRSDISMLMKKIDLILGQTKSNRIPLQLRTEHRPDGIVKSRKVLHEIECITRREASHSAGSRPAANTSPRGS